MIFLCLRTSVENFITNTNIKNSRGAHGWPVLKNSFQVDLAQTASNKIRIPVNFSKFKFWFDSKYSSDYRPSENDL